MLDLHQLAAQLDATDAHGLNALDRNERRRLADALRAWAYIAEASVHKPSADAKPWIRERGAGGRFKAGVLADLQDGDRAP